MSAYFVLSIILKQQKRHVKSEVELGKERVNSDENCGKQKRNNIIYQAATWLKFSGTLKI